MSSRAFEIPFFYEFAFHPLRGTKEKSIVAADGVRAEIREVSFKDAPLRLHAIDGGKRYLGREFEGQFYAPACYGGVNVVLTEPQRFVGFPGRHLDTLELLFPGREQMRLKSLGSRNVAERPTGISRVVRDGHDEVRQAVLDAASRLLLIEDRLYRQALPPKFAFHVRAESHWRTTLDNGGDWWPTSYAFAMDRTEDIKGFRERVEARGGVRVNPVSDVQILMSEWPMGYVPEIGNNAAFSTVSVLQSLGREIYRYPPEMIRIAMEMSKARGEYGEPAKDPLAIRSLLEDMLRALPAKDGLWLRRHIPNAIDAIDSSQDFDRAPLAAEDIDALEGFAP